MQRPLADSYPSKIPGWAALLFLLALIPFLHAQDRHQGFAEMAADAAAAREVGDTPRAIRLYTQALQFDPTWQEGWWSLGLLQYSSGAFAPASDSLSHLIALNETAGQAFAVRGLCEFETGDYPQSLADIRKGLASGAVEDAILNQTLRYHEAMLLTRLGDFEQALRVYSDFAKHKLSSPDLLIAIGLAGLRMPLLPREVKPDQRELLTTVGDATFKFKEGDMNAADLAFNNFFRSFPAVPNAHLLYGNLLLPFGPDAASPQFKQELDIAPDNKSAVAMLAWSLLMQGRAGDALPYAKRIAQADPDRADAQLLLGRALVDTGDVPAGIERLERGLKTEPQNLEIHIALAKAYSKSGRDDDARKERALCLRMTENDANPPLRP